MLIIFSFPFSSSPKKKKKNSSGSLCASPLSQLPGFEGSPLPGPDVVPLCKTGLVCRDFQGAYGVCGPAPSPPPTTPLIATGGEDASTAADAASAAAAAASTAPRFPSLTAVRVARRASLAGMQCRLPLRYKGRLLSDCDGALGDGGAPTGDKRCFVEGLNVTAICAPVPAATGGPVTESLEELEARGGLGDGRAGALCHLLPPTATMTATTATAVVPPVASCAAGYTCTDFASPPMAGGRFGWCKAPSQQKLVAGDASSLGAGAGLAAGGGATGAAKGASKASPDAPLPSFAGTPSMANPSDKQTARRNVIANANGTAAASAYPYAPRGVFGTPVPQGATANLGSSYYCGPLCMGGSFIAITLTVALMSWACVSLCCGGRSSGGNNGNAPAGSMSSPPPPAPQQRPATAPAASSSRPSPAPVALSLRPTRYERFEDVPETQQQQQQGQQQRPPQPLRPGSAATTPPSSGAAAGTTNPFAASYPSQPPPAWAPHAPLPPPPPPPPPAWPGHGGT